MTVRLGLFGTSWWADTMYMPALATHSDASVVAVCGRRKSHTGEFARRWEIERAYTDPDRMLEDNDLDGAIIATSNDSHFHLALACFKRRIHVLCEKPLGLSVTEAEIMSSAAGEAAVTTMVPFTYRFMPVNQWIQRLVSEGYVGRPRHINLRYYTDFANDTAYSWRFDKDIAGSGIIGDIGSHWIDLARWILGESEKSVSAVSSTFVDRDKRPSGEDYQRLEDSSVITVRYRSGAYGVLHVSAVCWEGTAFGQTHHLEVHGDEGTLYGTCDWDTEQAVYGLRAGEKEGRSLLPFPEDLVGNVRMDTVHNTYRDIFRTTEAMTRAWVSAIANGGTCEPTFADGLAVQRVVDAATASSAEGGCPIEI